MEVVHSEIGSQQHSAFSSLILPNLCLNSDVLLNTQVSIHITQAKNKFKVISTPLSCFREVLAPTMRCVCLFSCIIPKSTLQSAFQLNGQQSKTGRNIMSSIYLHNFYLSLMTPAVCTCSFLNSWLCCVRDNEVDFDWNYTSLGGKSVHCHQIQPRVVNEHRLHPWEQGNGLNSNSIWTIVEHFIMNLWHGRLRKHSACY